jgi:fluoride exporter
LGCLAIGFLAGLAETRSIFTASDRHFIFVRVLGGFTTFSSVALETLWLTRGPRAWPRSLTLGCNCFLDYRPFGLAIYSPAIGKLTPRD